MFPNRLLKFIILVLPLILTGIFSGCGGITTPGISQDTLSALITANTTSGEAPLEVIFVASESFAAQGNEIVSYEWDFGDGNTGKGQTIQYSFDSPGNYTVLLTINDNKGAVDTSSVIITVFHPTETVIEQNFNTQNGTEFDTGTGLRVYVPPSLSAEEVKLIVKYYSNPPQINDCIGNLFSAYSINMIYEKESQRQKLRPLRESFELIKLTFDIPEEEDIRSVLIVNKTDEGWVIAENKEGPYGGTISEDGEKILISLEYSSDYALSTPAVLTYNQQDMQELLSELEAQNAVIESAPPVIPNYKGTIIIPKEDFPEGEGTAIPIHIPPYKYSSNANMEEEGWKKKWEKIIRVTMKNWWALLATFEPGGVPLTPADAAVVFFEALVSASSNVNEIYDIAITIQENKNTAGNLRAIIQLGDPESVQWQRRLAGDKEAIGGSLCIYNICIGAFPGYLEVQNLCEKIGLPFEPSYFLQLESDKQHEYDKYIGYLSVNENNALVLIPKIYSDDQMAIWHFEKFLKPVLDIEIPILNSYRFSEDLETAILKELSPIQVGLESTQPNIIPVAKPDPPTPLSPGTTSSPGPTIDTLTPFLQWQIVSNADYYNLAISEYPYGTTNIIYNPQQISGSSITVPSGKLEVGKKYRWNMRAHNSTGFSDYSITLYFQTESTTMNKPDLIVSNIWTEPNPPIAAGYTTIGIEIKNQGNVVATETFFLEFYFDDTYQGHVYINGLTASSTNTSYWQAVTWPSDTNLHTIKGVVDPDNTIIESNENNNQYSIQVKATEPPIGIGTLKIESVPGIAKVYIDGVYKGETPSSGYLTISNLTAGDHNLKVTKSGYIDWIGVVTIPSNSIKYKAVILESTTASLPDPPTPLSPGTTSSPGPTIDTLTPFLQWQTVSNADYYNLAISEYPYGTTNIIYNPQQISGSSITVPSGKLEVGKKYRWNMRAHNSTGFSDYSITLYFQTGLITCTSPGSFTLNATPECNGITSQIRLNWTNSSGVSSYDVYRNSTLYYSGLTGTQFINSGNITAGTSYSYYILAKNSCDSTTSNIVSATAINCDSTVSARIDSYSPSSKITINTGQSFIISTSFTNTGNTAAYFYAGVSIWDSNGNVIFNGWGGKTYLNKGQQGSASWNHTINTPGEYWLQFGVWNEAKSELLDKKPSPSQNLIKVFSLSSQTERLTNGSFSSGTSGWNLVGDFWAGTNFSNYRTPPGYAAGGVNSAGLPINNAVGYMYQTVNIPSGATSATLSFWYNVTSEETGSTVYDVLNVTIKNSTGNYLATVAVLSNLNKSSLGSYSKVTFDVTPYKGQTIRVHFLATTDSSVFTVFRIDDISLMSDG